MSSSLASSAPPWLKHLTISVLTHVHLTISVLTHVTICVHTREHKCPSTRTYIQCTGPSAYATSTSPPQWQNWSNLGVRSREKDCCAPNTFPQLIGDAACGAPITPNAADRDLSSRDVLKELPRRLCDRSVGCAVRV
jgi:hypothetical protein